MGGSKRRGAFTLIEVLIVVVIMAVLAATIIPQFTNSTTDAKVSTARFNLHTLRSQIELYRLHHNGNLPTITNNLQQLTRMTNAAGDLGTDPEAYPYGPYIQSIPKNPFSNVDTVRADSETNPTTAFTGGTDGGGWAYRPTTGQIYIDHPEYDSEL